MIRNLSQQAFRLYGTILPEKEQAPRYANHHSIALSRETASLYQTAADLWLTAEAGQTILSVSADNEQFEDFYLDRPVLLHGGVWFYLTALQGSASVQLSAYSFPRLLATKAAADRFTVRPQLQITALYTLFYQEKEQGFLFSGEAHSMTELIYIDRGSLHSVADGLDILLEQGELVVYAPNQWHMQYADVGVAPRVVRICFDVSGEDLKGLINRKFRASRSVATLLQQILREHEQMGAHATDMIFSLLQTLLILLLRETGAGKLQAVNAANNENAIIGRAQQYISAHVREKLSVPVVAKNTDVSPSYLTALFHKHLQISPGEYIRRIKLQESKQMIREGNLNFTEISEALQYSTVHHFSRQFKEKFGITPTEYARSVRG